MPFLTLTALMFTALPPPIQPAPDGGFQLGIGGPSWQLARKLEDDAGFGPVGFTVDGGIITSSPLRQGCSAALGCSFAAPGLLLARGVGQSSPAVAVRLHSISSDGVDVRVGFVEAQADGGLACLQLLSEGGPRADLFVGNWGCDGVSLHVVFDPTSATLRQLTLVAAEGSLNEVQRTDLSSRLTPGPTLPVVLPATLRWSLTPMGLGAAFTVDFGGQRSTAMLSALDLAGVPHADAVPFADGTLDLDRLVPMLYLGWAVFVDPSRTADLQFSLEGDGLDVEPTQLSEGVFSVAVRAVDERGAAVSRNDTVEVRLAASRLPDVVLTNGVGQLDVTVPAPGSFTLELQSASDPWLRGQATLTGPLDGGAVTPDAGAVTADAGAEPTSERSLRVGCGCAQVDLGLALAALVLLRRRARQDPRRG